MQGRDIVKKNRFKAPAWFSKCGIFTRLELQCMLTLIFSSIQNVSTHITCKLYINFLRNNHFSKQNLVFSIFAKRALKSLELVKKPQTFEIFYYYVVRAYSPFFSWWEHFSRETAYLPCAKIVGELYSPFFGANKCKLRVSIFSLPRWTNGYMVGQYTVSHQICISIQFFLLLANESWKRTMKIWKQ